MKNWCFLTVVLEKTLESPLDSKEIQPVHPKGNQFWIYIGKTDAQAETPVLWPSDVKNWLIWKDPDAGKDWRQEEKGTTEDEMVGWHHRLDGHDFGQAPGTGDGQEAWHAVVRGVAESQTWLSNWTEPNLFYSQVNRETISPWAEQRHFSLAGGQGPPDKPLSMIIIRKASHRNSFQHGVRIGFLPAIMWLSFDLLVGSVVWDFW